MADRGRNPGISSSNASPDPKRLRRSLAAQEAITEPTGQKIAAPESPEQKTPSDSQTQERTTLAALPVVIADPLPEDGFLEADDDLTSDSEFGTDSSDTTSVSSSMFEGYLENGRRYQTKREGEYWGPSDEKQFQTMQAAHLQNVILESQEPNPYFRSPIPETAQNILDVGTGNGAWAIEVAERYPSALVQGVDLHPPPENWVPPNCRFEVDDLLKPWEFKENGRFDLIHIRYLIGAFTENQWKGFYKQAYENLAPGGWIEQLEPSVETRCDDGTLNPDGEYASWHIVVPGSMATTGKNGETEAHMRAHIEAAGFTNVHEKLYRCPIGDWAKHPVLKEAGKFNKIQFLQGMEGYAMFLLTHFGLPEPWRPEEVQVYLAKVRKELNDPRVHAYHHIRRVWAQKPTVE